jgi:hypothetical protein
VSQITADHSHAHGHAGAHHHDEPHVLAAKKLDPALVTMAPRSGTMLMYAFFFVGLVAIVVLLLSVSGGKPAIKHAMASWHTGVLYSLGLMLGCLGTQMIFQQVNAGWSAAVRRQAENVASLAWVIALLALPVFAIELFADKPMLFKWMDPTYTAGDPIYAHKAGYLNQSFWAIRGAVYFLIWIWLGTRLFRLSRKQDETGDKWITAKSRFISSYGLLLFALTTAFASFDWLMSLDYHWFSTMFGVYFFAGSIVSSTALLAVILTSLRIKGKLGPTFTKEHQHDLGKLLFAFTVFWAYITLCQYFLIWYSNIPEETAFYVIRKQGLWSPMGMFICAGHFAVPFLLLLIRNVKRNPHTLRFVALWMLVMHAFDLIYLVRPIIEKGDTGVKFGTSVWIDVFGVLGPVCILLGFVIWRLTSVPLVPIKDPRLHEVLEHKNYV